MTSLSRDISCRKLSILPVIAAFDTAVTNVKVDETRVTIHAAPVERELLRIPQELVDVEPIRNKHIGSITAGVLAVQDAAHGFVVGRAAVRARERERTADILAELIQELEQARVDVRPGFLSAITSPRRGAGAQELLIREVSLCHLSSILSFVYTSVLPTGTEKARILQRACQNFSFRDEAASPPRSRSASLFSHSGFRFGRKLSAPGRIRRS